jgi:hypothetical protein
MGFLIRDKYSKKIQESHEMALKIENNLSSYNLEPFSTPVFNMGAKPKVVHNVEATSDIGINLEKLKLNVDGIIKTQELIMNRIVILERAQQQYLIPPYKGKFQRTGQGFKPKNNQEVPKILALTNMVEESPWCFHCKESHWEHECSLNNGDHDQVNIMNHTFEEP